jgi:hypothetical protein
VTGCVTGSASPLGALARFFLLWACLECDILSAGGGGRNPPIGISFRGPALLCHSGGHDPGLYGAHDRLGPVRYAEQMSRVAGGYKFLALGGFGCVASTAPLAASSNKGRAFVRFSLQIRRAECGGVCGNF